MFTLQKMVKPVQAEGNRPCRSLEGRALRVSVQDPLEGCAEVLVEDGVDDRVEAGVAVADPEEEGEERFGGAAALRAHRPQRVGEEEGEPADDKHAHHHSQDEGELLLPVHHGFAAGDRRLLSLRRGFGRQLGARRCFDGVFVFAGWTRVQSFGTVSVSLLDGLLLSNRL